VHVLGSREGASEELDAQETPRLDTPRRDLRALPGYRVEEHLVLIDEEARTSNTVEEPERVRPQSRSGAEIVDGHLRTVLPPLSRNVVRLGREAKAT
jgi:alpha-L-arabinofuranosidase